MLFSSGLFIAAFCTPAYAFGKWFRNPWAAAPSSVAPVPSNVSTGDAAKALNSIADSLYDWHCTNLGDCSSSSNLQSRLENLKMYANSEKKEQLVQELKRPLYTELVKTLDDYKSGSVSAKIHGYAAEASLLDVVSKVIEAKDLADQMRPMTYDGIIIMLFEAYSMYFLDHPGLAADAKSKGSPRSTGLNSIGGMSRSSSSYSYSSKRSSFG